MKISRFIVSLLILLSDVQILCADNPYVTSQTIVLRGNDLFATTFLYDEAQREIVRSCIKNGLPYAYITSDYVNNDLTQTTYAWQNNQWNPILKKIDRVTELNQPYTTQYQTNHDGSFTDSLSISWTYNANTVSIITQQQKNGVLQNMQKQDIINSTDSLTQQIKIFQWNSINWQPQSQIQCFYVSNGNGKQLQRILHQTWDSINNQWMSERETIYFYNNSLCMEELTKTIQKGILIPMQRILYNYNSLNFLSNETYQSWGNNLWINELRIHYDYDAMHHLMMKTLQIYHFKQWQPLDQIQFTSNGNGQTLSAASNQLFWDTHPGAGFDTHIEVNLPQKNEIMYGHNLKITYQSSTSITTLPRETTASTIAILPNPSSNGIFFFASLSQKPLSWTIYDTNGKIVSISNPSMFYIDLSDVPNGMYIAKMITQQGIITKKLIVAKH